MRTLRTPGGSAHADGRAIRTTHRSVILILNYSSASGLWYRWVVKTEVPLTLEGASVLHQMFRVRWQAWKSQPEGRRREALEEATRTFTGMEQSQSAMFSLLGHKGDLMLLHFRNSF